MRHIDWLGQFRIYPVYFCEMYAGWAFVVCSSFDSVHVSASWKMAMCRFDDEDSGAVLHSVECLSWNIPVDGSEGILGPVVPFDELLANSWASSSLS